MTAPSARPPSAKRARSGALSLLEAVRGGKLDIIDKEINRIIVLALAKVEHPFQVVKHQFDHLKTANTRLAKNRAKLFTLFALGNLFLVRRRLMA